MTNENKFFLFKKMNPTDKIELMDIDVSVLDDMISELQQIITPNLLHLRDDFLEYDEEYSKFHWLFFSLFFGFDEKGATDLLKTLDDSRRKEIAIQLANGRLFCKIAQDRGWKRLAIPKDVSLFLSVVPKRFLLAANEERISKGLLSNPPGFLSLEVVPPKNESN